MVNKKAIHTLEAIKKDTKDDAHSFNGKEFNGRNVAAYLGNLGAAIYALAVILEEHLEEKG